MKNNRNQDDFEITRGLDELKKLVGTFKSKKTIAQLMKEIDEGWKE